MDAFAEYRFNYDKQQWESRMEDGVWGNSSIMNHQGPDRTAAWIRRHRRAMGLLGDREVRIVDPIGKPLALSDRQIHPAFPSASGMNAVITGITTREGPPANVKPNANALAVHFLDRLSPADRKQYPIATGVFDYFPDALALVARVSKIGNDQHNPGEPMHWARSKSNDQADTILRHLMSRGTVDTDGVLHSAKLAWRALALLQTEIEYFAEAAREAGLEYRPGLAEPQTGHPAQP